MKSFFLMLGLMVFVSSNANANSCFSDAECNASQICDCKPIGSHQACRKAGQCVDRNQSINKAYKNFVESAMLSDAVIDQKIVLTEDLSIDTGKVVFKSGGQIVTQGFELRIIGEQIVVEADYNDGEPSILGFEKRGMAIGENGRNAGSVYIFAKSIMGGNLVINNSGEDGAVGALGAKGRKGNNGRDGRGRVHKDLRGCVGTSSRPGGKGFKGEKGDAGGNSGDGGDVVFAIESFSEKIKVVSVLAGVPGEGGDGGEGGEGGDGGNRGHGRGGCGSVSASSDGALGDKGDQGDLGLRGRSGEIHDLLDRS